MMGIWASGGIVASHWKNAVMGNLSSTTVDSGLSVARVLTRTRTTLVQLVSWR
jgi:hypothetical protein